MTKKSKSYVEEAKCLNPEYMDALENLWTSCLDMMTHTQNELGEIFRLSSIVYLFAKQKAKIDALRAQLAEAKENSDLYVIKLVAKRAGYMQEEKAFDKMWAKVALEYDNIVNNFIAQTNNEDMLIQINTSEEILEKSAKGFAESKAEEYNLAIKTAEAMIDF